MRTLFRLKGRGAGPATARGDAHVRVLVETPVELTAAQRELLEGLRQTIGTAQLPKRAAFLAQVQRRPKP